MTDASTQPGSTAKAGHRKSAPLLTSRTLLLLAAALLVTVLFVREHRRQQGPCRVEFHARVSNQPHLLRVQDEDENPGNAGPPADPCHSQSVFGFSPERAYAALALALWAVTAFCSAQDIAIFRKDRRRRQRRIHHDENQTSIKGRQVL